MKPQEKKKEQTVGRIVNAALETFAESGFEGARIDEIAARASVNKAMIYYYIGDKQSLYARVLEDVFSHTAARIAERVNRAQTPVQKVKAYIRGMAATFTQHPLLPPIMMREFASGGRNVPESVAEHMLRILDTVSGILQQGRRQRVFVRIHPLVLHLMVVGTMTFLRSTHPVRLRLASAAQKETLLPDVEDAAAWLADVEKLVLRAIRR